MSLNIMLDAETLVIPQNEDLFIKPYDGYITGIEVRTDGTLKITAKVNAKHVVVKSYDEFDDDDVFMDTVLVYGDGHESMESNGGFGLAWGNWVSTNYNPS